MIAPRLAAAKLTRRNLGARRGLNRSRAVLLTVCLLLALFWAQAAIAPPLAWLRTHGLLSAGVAAIASAMLIARRRAVKRTAFARSWLAAVPVKASTARWESLLIEMFPAILVIGVLAIACLSYALVLAIAKSAERSAPFAVWAYLSAGIAAGMGGSFLVPQPKPVDLPPGSRYVPHQKSKRTAGVRASLRALGIWPIRQAFAWAQPKIVARATIPVLLIMPLGTTADSAMVAIGLFGALAALLLVCSGAISAGRLARRWLAPLPARSGEVIRAFLLPGCAVIVAASAIEAALLMVLNVSYRTSVKIGFFTALIGCLITSAGLIATLRQASQPGPRP